MKMEMPLENRIRETTQQRDEITRQIAGLVAERDGALLAGSSRDVIAALDRKIEASRAALKTEEDRLAVFERAIADRDAKARADAQDAAIASVEKILADRDEAGRKLADLIGQTVAAFQEVHALNEKANAASGFSVGEGMAALFGASLTAAVGQELYRLSGNDRGIPDQRLRHEFPGARRASITDARPEAVQPLAERIAEASAYAVQVLRRKQAAAA